LYGLISHKILRTFSFKCSCLGLKSPPEPASSLKGSSATALLTESIGVVAS
jgi:hypothetical protein